MTYKLGDNRTLGCLNLEHHESSPKIHGARLFLIQSLL